MPSPSLLKSFAPGSASGTGSISDPEIIQLSGGNIVVAHATTAQGGAGDAPGQDIVAQIFDPVGNLVRDTFRLNQANFDGDEGDFSIAATATGGFRMMYVDKPSSTQFDFVLESYDAGGTMTDNRVVDTVTNTSGSIQSLENRDFAALDPVLIEGSGGQVHFTYELRTVSVIATDAITGNATKIVGKTLDLGAGTVSTLLPFGLLRVEKGTAVLDFHPMSHDLIRKSDGGLAVVGHQNGLAFSTQLGQLVIDPDRGPNRSVTTVVKTNGGDPKIENMQVTQLSNGNLVVVWQQDDTLAGTDVDIFARLYDSSGSALAAAVQVNGSGAAPHGQPRVAALDNGQFVVSYQDGGFFKGIRHQTFNADGSKDDFGETLSRVSGNTPQAHDMIRLSDGRFASFVVDEDGTGADSLRAAFFTFGAAFDQTPIGDGGHVIGTGNSEDFDITATLGYFFGAGGNDKFELGAAGAPLTGSTIDGGTGNDDLDVIAGGTFNLRGVTIKEIGDLRMFNAGDKTIQMVSSQFGTDLFDPSGRVIGTALSQDTLDILVDVAGGSFSAANLTFQNWTNDFLRITGEAGFNTLTGHGTVATILDGKGGTDFLLGGAANDLLLGGDDPDILFHSGGVDSFNGGSGIDYVTYANAGGPDVVGINLANQALNSFLAAGETFTDIEAFFLTQNNDAFVGDTANNFVFAQGGNDLIIGGGGGDIIFGEGGSDTISSGVLSDIVVGGSGADTFLYTANQLEIDQVLDFTPGVDTLAFDDVGFNFVGQTPVTGVNFITTNASVGANAAAGQSAIIYYSDLGLLYADTDGTGGFGPNLIAALSGTPTLSASDLAFV